MAEYIEREAAVAVCDEQYKECLRKSDFCGDTVAGNICADIKAIPAADVAPVVHCRECENSYEAVSGRICAYGVCVDCVVPEDFFCSYGAKMDGGAENV